MFNVSHLCFPGKLGSYDFSKKFSVGLTVFWSYIAEKVGVIVLSDRASCLDGYSFLFHLWEPYMVEVSPVRCLVVEAQKNIHTISSLLAGDGKYTSSERGRYSKPEVEVILCTPAEALATWADKYFKEVYFGEKVPARNPPQSGIDCSALAIAQSLRKENPDILVSVYGVKNPARSAEVLAERLGTPTDPLVVRIFCQTGYFLTALDGLPAAHPLKSAALSAARLTNISNHPTL